MAGFSNCVCPVVLGMKGARLGKNNRDKHCLLCVSLCGCVFFTGQMFWRCASTVCDQGIDFSADFVRFLCLAASGDG